MAAASSSSAASGAASGTACFCAESREFIRGAELPDGSRAALDHAEGIDAECLCSTLRAAGTTSDASAAYARSLAGRETSSSDSSRPAPRTLLAKNCRVLVTMSDGPESAHGVAKEYGLGTTPEACVYCVDGVIKAVGPLADMPEGATEADTVLDCSNHVVLPGLVNTHHHMYQSLTRCYAQDESLFEWLIALYPVWQHLTPEGVRVSAKTVMAEMILTGTTCSSDHLYIYPNGVRLEDEIEAAREVGMRFHAARGALSRGKSEGGLPPDSLVEKEDAVVAEMKRLVETHHDPSRYSMLRVVLAPCSPFSVTDDLMRRAAQLARKYPRVSLHTHLAENDSDIDYSLSEYGARPGDYADKLGWVGPDCWHAHCVKLDDRETTLFASTGTGIAHCPTSNLRLASGIAPVREMLDKGVHVALGVDGSASNDGAHMLNEARMMMLLQRVNHSKGAATMGVREALRVATVGGARVLGRDDIGVIAPGYAADFIAFDMSDVALTGALHDVTAALLLCMPDRVDLSVIDGKVVVQGGELKTADLPALVKRHNELSTAMFDAAGVAATVGAATPMPSAAAAATTAGAGAAGGTTAGLS